MKIKISLEISYEIYVALKRNIKTKLIS